MEASRDWRANDEALERAYEVCFINVRVINADIDETIKQIKIAVDRLHRDQFSMGSSHLGLLTLFSSKNRQVYSYILTTYYGDFEWILFPKQRIMYLIDAHYHLIIVLVISYKIIYCTVYTLRIPIIMCRCFIASPMHSHWSNSAYFVSLFWDFYWLSSAVCIQ